MGRRCTAWPANLYNGARTRGLDHPHAARVAGGAVCVIWHCRQHKVAYGPVNHHVVQTLFNQHPHRALDAGHLMRPTSIPLFGGEIIGIAVLSAEQARGEGSQSSIPRTILVVTRSSNLSERPATMVRIALRSPRCNRGRCSPRPT